MSLTFQRKFPVKVEEGRSPKSKLTAAGEGGRSLYEAWLVQSSAREWTMSELSGSASAVGWAVPCAPIVKNGNHEA